MAHDDSTRLLGRRLKHWMRLAAPVGFLLTCALLAGFAQIASATTYDMRGEWSIELKSAKESPLHKTGVVDQMDLTTGEFSGTLHEGSITSQFEGTLSGTTASITITSHTPLGTVSFATQTATVNTTTNSLSGPGIYYYEGNELEPAEISGTRTKTYLEVQEREARELKEREEKAAKEKKQREELEAKEAKERQEKEETATKEKQAKEELEAKEAKEAKERQEKEETTAKQKAEREAREKTERETREKQEREASEQRAKEAGANQDKANQSSATLVSVEPTTKTFTVAGSGSLSLGLTNPNGFAAQGRVTLVMSATSKAARASAAHKKSKKEPSLGAASFTISAHAQETVKISLSREGRTELTHHKTIRALLTIVTDTSGKQSMSKLYTLTLRAAAHARH